MSPKDVVLLVLDASDGAVSGKTLLQKLCYFVQVSLGLELGFSAHHYGPYSAGIEEAVGGLRSLGFLEEEPVGFGVANPSGFGELRRYDYRLTHDGKTLVAHVKQNEAQLATRISDVVGRIKATKIDYLDLSISAKIFFILTRQNKPMTEVELRSEATKFSWTLQPNAIERALDLLRRLDLVS